MLRVKFKINKINDLDAPLRHLGVTSMTSSLWQHEIPCRLVIGLALAAVSLQCCRPSLFLFSCNRKASSTCVSKSLTSRQSKFRTSGVMLQNIHRGWTAPSAVPRQAGGAGWVPGFVRCLLVRHVRHPDIAQTLPSQRLFEVRTPGKC